VRTLMVNGVLAIDNGKVTGKAAGQPVKHRPTPKSCG